MFKFFKDSPARRDIYVELTRCTDFPKRFCPTRWTENEDVASRAISTWPNVQKVIKHFQGLVPSSQPKNNKSYDILVKYVNDPFMMVKFHILKEMAHKLNAFLVTFQTDFPMIPFLSDALESILRSIMKRFVLKDKLEKANTAYLLINVDLSKPESLLPPDQVSLFSYLYNITMFLQW